MLQPDTLDAWMTAGRVTNAALARRIGVSRPYVLRIRTGARQPSLPVAIKLADETGLPIEVFVKEAA